MSIGSILKTKGAEIIAARPDDTAEQVAKLLSAHNIGAVLIKGADGTMLGLRARIAMPLGRWLTYSAAVPAWPSMMRTL